MDTLKNHDGGKGIGVETEQHMDIPDLVDYGILTAVQWRDHGETNLGPGHSGRRLKLFEERQEQPVTRRARSRYVQLSHAPVHDKK